MNWQQYQPAVEEYLKSILSEKGFLYEKALYQHGFIDVRGNLEKIPQSGKLLRPTLLLLIVDGLTGGNWKSAIPAAAALQLFHNATLIIDDWQDKDAFRRGRKALWTMEDIGPEQAMNVGIFLFPLSSKVLLQLSPNDYSSLQKESVLYLFEKAKMDVIEGQQMDIAFEKQQTVAMEEYMKMIQLKTASLIEVAVTIGGVLGGADKNLLNTLSHLGREMGLVFQMQDDYLGVYGDTEKTGKPSDDKIHRKKTLATISNDKQQVKEMIEKKYQKVLGVFDTITYEQLTTKEELQSLADFFAHREK